MMSALRVKSRRNTQLLYKRLAKIESRNRGQPSPAGKFSRPTRCGLSTSNRHAEESAQLTFASFNVNGLSHEGVWHLNDLISSQQYDVSNHYPLIIRFNILLILFVILIY